jgi:hypothetical protein
VAGWTDCSGVIIKVNSVQLQLQLPARTELGKNMRGGGCIFQIRFLVEVKQSYKCHASNCVKMSCFDTFTGWTGGWVGGWTVQE